MGGFQRRQQEKQPAALERRPRLFTSSGMCRCAVIDVHFYCSVSREPSDSLKPGRALQPSAEEQQNSALLRWCFNQVSATTTETNSLDFAYMTPTLLNSLYFPAHLLLDLIGTPALDILWCCADVAFSRNVVRACVWRSNYAGGAAEVQWFITEGQPVTGPGLPVLGRL